MTIKGMVSGISMHKLTLQSDLVFAISVCIIIGLGAALRIIDLGTEGYELDEVDTALIAQGNIQKIISDPEGRPPVYLFLAHFWMDTWGSSEEATRFSSALAGIISIGLMIMVGCELFGKMVGLISGFFMSVSEFQIFYSQEFRYYALFVLLTLVSYYFFIKALKGGKPGNIILYIVATIFLLYVQTIGIFVLAAQVLYILLQWRQYRDSLVRWFSGFVIIALAFIPGLIAFMKAAGSELLDWLPAPQWWRPFLTIAKFIFPLTVIHSRPYPSVKIILASVVFLCVGTIFYILWLGRKQWLESAKNLISTVGASSKVNKELRLVGFWFLCPIFSPFIFSLAMPMYLDRYAIGAAPALYLLLAVIVVSLHKLIPQAILLGSFVVLIAPGLQGYYVATVKEQWRESAAYIFANSQDGDVIVFAPDNGNSYGFNWYYQGNLPKCSLDEDLTENQTISPALEKCLVNMKRFWVVMRAPERYAQLSTFFTEAQYPHMNLERKRELMDISIYLFSIPEK